MEAARSRPSWNVANLDSPFHTVILMGAVAMLCFLASKVAYALRIPPHHIALFWPATPFLAAVLLLVPRRIWPVLIATGLGAMALADFENGVPIGFEIWFSLGDLAAVLVAALGIGLLGKGVPTLSTGKTLAKHLGFAVIVAPFASAFVGAAASARGGYWSQWRIWFFSDALAFLTVTPAILSWVDEGREWARKSRNYVEFGALMTLLVLFGYLIFMGTEHRESPALLYSLVPLLLWSALRLGLKGVSTSLVLVTFLSIWGAAHGRGPFVGPGLFDNVFSLQLFLFFAAIPFMVLAVFVREQKRVAEALIDEITERKVSETELALANDRLRLAMEAGKAVGWDRDIKSGRDSLFGDLRSIFGIPSDVFNGRVEDFHRYLHPEDRARIVGAVEDAMHAHTHYAAEFRLRWPDGTVRWLTAKGKFYYSREGEPERMLGAAIDFTDRKLAEDALRESEERLRLAAQAGKMYAFDWDVTTDAIIRSEESAHIFGLSGEPVRLTKQELLVRVHPEDRAKFVNSLAECTPESPTTQISYRLLRPDGSIIWLERTGHAFFDQQGKMVRMIGLVADISQRKLAEEKLLEYERAVEGAEEMIVVVDRDYRYLIANNKFVKMRNMIKEQVVGRYAHEVLNKGVFELVLKEKLDQCFQGKVVRFEMKYTYPELGERDLFISYFPIEGPNGVERVACIAQDITERKRAEEALSTVSQKLIEAQEEERTRIARELHDDINQRLALLTVQLDSLKPAEIRNQIGNLAGDIQTLSHRLHSPKLDFLGLASAAAGFCREMSEQQNLEIEFRSENIPKQLPSQISLCLFRVIQEALQNATKHSGSRHFQVSLKGGPDHIELTVQDSGIGFNVEEAIKGRGLGLISMQERLKLVDGQLSIDSKPQRGTTIHAQVPFRLEMKSAGSVG